MNNIMLICIIFLMITILTIITTNIYIKFIKNKVQQPLLKEGPQHQSKIGTPTMGGVSFLLVFLITTISLLLYYHVNIRTFILSIFILFVIFIYFYIGFKDDYQKVLHKKNTSGLTPKEKIIYQLIGSIILSIGLYLCNYDLTLKLHIVNFNINIGYFYYLLIPFFLIGITNATNLTDGLDGLLSFNAIITLVFISIISFEQKEFLILYSNLIFIAVLLGFFLINKYPAKIFMGDVGSLTIGAYIAIISILLKIEILLLFFGFIYMIETLSVILQVSYFKYTKKKYKEGQRLFLMAPIHHHFEKKGLKEKQVLYLFAIINITMSIIGIIFYYN